MANFDPYYAKISNPAPSSYDWRNYNKVCEVKDQVSCGSCWAFETIGNLEAQFASRVGGCKKFSEQMLIDCDTSDSGCNGGLMECAFAYLKKSGVLCFADGYTPYKGIKGNCGTYTHEVDMKVTGYKKLGSSYSTWSPVDEGEIKEFLYQTGPLAIVLNAAPLQTYSSGILDLPSTECPSSEIIHAVLLVQYGTD